MKTNIVKVVFALLGGAASTAYAASTTVAINAIDANGVGKEIGTYCTAMSNVIASPPIRA